MFPRPLSQPSHSIGYDLVNRVELKSSNTAKLSFINIFYLELETGMAMYDSLTQAEIFVQCPVLCMCHL